MVHIASGTGDGLFRLGQDRAGDGGGHGRQSVGPSLARKNPGQRCSGRAQTPASVAQGERFINQASSCQYRRARFACRTAPLWTTTSGVTRVPAEDGSGGGASGSHRPRALSRPQGYPACPQVTENEGLNVTGLLATKVLNPAVVDPTFLMRVVNLVFHISTARGKGTLSNEGWRFEGFTSNHLRRLMTCPPLISPQFSQFFQVRTLRFEACWILSWVHYW